jgi:hypothetical protein
MDSISFSYSKAALLDALEARRPYLKRRDAKAVAAHKAEEQKALAKFQAACRKALKWNYATAKEKGTRYSTEIVLERLSCPTLCIPMLDRVIEQVQRDGRIRYSVTSNGQFSRIHFLLSCDDRKPEAC